jgi:tetratricopeptide (TPR) repeat protein
MADQSLEVDQGTWQLLSYCYEMNDQPERAREALERASRETPYSAIDLQLAERNWREQRFADTISNLESALRKGDVDRPGDLWILMTSAAMELRDIDRAEKALATARTFPEQAAKVDRLERSLARLKQSLEQ